ncbi:DUF6895 family protein [Dyella choica]|uniref:DUF6895 domain-containing protein n=1 Tax=Dyella choica TaxID=1927959 RepID=A0A432MAH6_9GAMM|nr:hypothetical protein [Dyella choica]RUL78918.1 hypothetical protein EKH80_03715 [Dyella choica]
MSAVRRTWDTGDLQRRLFRVLDLAEQVITHLAYNGYVDTVDSHNTVRPEKIIAETAFLLWVASHVKDCPGISARVDNLARQLIPYARSKRMLLHICLEPTHAMECAQAHILLGQLGFIDTEFDAAVAASLESQAAQGRERPPHRVLEQLWFDDLRSSSTPGAGHSGNLVAKQTLLYLPLDLLHGGREDIYAFTHALMYTSRFQKSPLKWPKPPGEIRATAACLLARCLDDEDYDLCGELLLSWPLTRGRWNAAATFVFHVLAHVEDVAGFLPTPATRLNKLDTLTGLARRRYMLATAYHTIYVMGVLCASILGLDHHPPLRIPVHSANSGASKCILEQIESGDSRPHWVEIFIGLRDAERDAIAGLLFDLAVVRSTRLNDFDRLLQILKTGHRFGLTASPAASQCAELLNRMTEFARITNRLLPAVIAS